MKTGRIFVISAPSGTGKSTVGNLVRMRLPDLAYSVSLTTRPPRQGEQDGVEYYFVSRTDFEKRLSQGEIAEHAEIYGNLYGTSAKVLADTLAQGQDLLLEIDVRGAEQLRLKFPQGVFIFLLPPSLEELERRLRTRGSEDEVTIQKRLARARMEMDQASRYDYQVLNDDLEQAVGQVVGIISERRGGS